MFITLNNVLVVRQTILNSLCLLITRYF